MDRNRRRRGWIQYHLDDEFAPVMQQIESYIFAIDDYQLDLNWKEICNSVPALRDKGWHISKDRPWEEHLPYAYVPGPNDQQARQQMLTQLGTSLAENVDLGSPVGLAAYLGMVPTELHRAYGILGKTGAEPKGTYNLGIRSPGERSAPKKQGSQEQDESP